jgi:hypothetical protein
MLPKLAAAGAFLIALLAILGSFSQVTALHLRQESQPLYWPRRGTTISGLRYNNRWQPRANRADYGEFRGGGIGAGK